MAEPTAQDLQAPSRDAPMADDDGVTDLFKLDGRAYLTSTLQPFLTHFLRWAAHVRPPGVVGVGGVYLNAASKYVPAAVVEGEVEGVGKMGYRERQAKEFHSVWENDWVGRSGVCEPCFR
ncbi:hypothetical protein PYCC9005_000656 [Savitreella phatthalungensis]